MYWSGSQIKREAMRMKVNEKDVTCKATVRVEWEE